MTLRFREELNRVCASKEWEKLLKELRVATNRRYGWLQKPGGSSPEDLVYEAIARGLSGERQWPEGVKIDLFGFLWNVVRSIASHEADSLVGAPECVSLHGKGGQKALKASNPGPGEIIEGHDLYERFLNTLDGRPELAAVLKGKLRGLTQHEIAQQLGVKDPKVSRLVTELAERWLKFCEE